MTVRALALAANLTELTHVDTDRLDRAVAGGYVGDLLSDTIAHGRPGMAWITVQTHLNVIAVSILLDFAMVVVPNGLMVPSQTICKASHEGIPVYATTHSAYDVCCAFLEAGLRPVGLE